VHIGAISSSRPPAAASGIRSDSAAACYTRPMVKIRLRRIGKKGQPSYRVVVTDARSPRDGRFIENIGSYDPMREPSFVEIDGPRALEWIGKGAQPSQAVTRLMEVAGVIPRKEPAAASKAASRAQAGSS
jgi:small subunit ribosomal protein S16